MPPVGYNAGMPKKILALVAEPVSADALRSAVGEEDANSAEVLVVAPALNTKKRFFLADPDPAIERAEAVQEETVERLDEAGIDAAGDTGEEDPLLALQDALVSYDADEIVLFTHAGGKQNWLEDGLVEQAKERFDAPVRHMVVD
jgi:hypothetical protein